MGDQFGCQMRTDKDFHALVTLLVTPGRSVSRWPGSHTLFKALEGNLGHPAVSTPFWFGGARKTPGPLSELDSKGDTRTGAAGVAVAPAEGR